MADQESKMKSSIKSSHQSKYSKAHESELKSKPQEYQYHRGSLQPQPQSQQHRQSIGATREDEAISIYETSSEDEDDEEGEHRRRRHFDFSRFQTRSEFLDQQHLRGGPVGKLSTWGASIIYFNFMMDINQFSIGYAFANCGYVLGSMVLLMFWILSLLNQHLLMRVYERLKTQRGKLVKADMCELVKITMLSSKTKQYRKLAKYSLLIVDIVLVSHMLARCAGLFLDSQQIIGMLLIEPRSTIFYKVQIMLFTPLWLCTLPNELKKHVYLQTSMMATTFILMSMCLAYLFEKTHIPIKYDVFAPRIRGIFILLKTAFESFLGINILPYLRNEMANPQLLSRQFGIINCGMCFNLIITIMFGFFTMKRFGRYMEEQFGHNFRLEESLARCICVGQIIVGLSSFVLIMYIPINVILPRIFQRVRSRNGQLAVAALLRAFLILSIIYFSMLRQVLEHLKDFCQMVFCTFLTTFLPPYLYYVINRHHAEPWKLQLVKCTMSLGVLGSLSGIGTMIYLGVF